MITEHDLREAIAECQGERNPNAQTCIKLAAYYTILENIREPERRVDVGYSYAPAPDVITYDSGTEFSRLVHGKTTEKVIAIMDELMDALRVLNLRLYNGVLRKLEE